MPLEPDVAVIGAGFCGTLAAIHLARAGLRVALLERTGRFGPGLAYGAAGPAHVHLLNTPAGRMSAVPDDPDHFTRWARARDPSVTGGSFLARRDYAAYLEALLAEATCPSGQPGSTCPSDQPAITCLPGRVLDIVPEPRGYSLELDGGRSLRAAAVVLATGNLPPADPPALAALRDPRYVRDPWDRGTWPAFDPDAPVLLLGTGLTALDLALSLADAGHRGPIHLASRRGLLPQPHRSPARLAAYVLPDLSEWPGTARGQLRALRSEVRRAADAGVDWRDVVAALRAHTPGLWRRLTLAEQDRFLRHLRPYWDSHRHRAAPATHAAIEALRAEGRLHLHAAAVHAAEPAADALHLDLRRRGGRRDRLDVALLLNCTGPTTDATADPLLARLIARGLARPDPLGLGLDIDDLGRPRAADGLTPDLYIAGPLRRPQLWESTAVLELAPQVAALAALLTAR